MKKNITGRFAAVSFLPARLVCNNAPGEGEKLKLENAESSESVESDEQALTEAKAVYTANWNRLRDDIDEWAKSDNPKIKELAARCEQAISGAGLDAPGKTPNLTGKKIRKKINTMIGIMESYYPKIREELGGAGARAADVRAADKKRA